ncbi:endothelin-converting enzyme homolog isoform X2 [Bacillus rossius redtenbacheri]
MYKQAEFEDDSSSVGSVQLAEGVSATSTHIRYHTGTTLWKARTLLEKGLLVLAALLALVVFILGTLLSVTSKQVSLLRVQHVDGRGPGDLCLTLPCVMVASSILESLNQHVDPCHDFYEFSCGGWVKNNPIPYEKSIWGTFGKLEQQNQLVIKNVLERPESEFASDAERKAKHYYASCMDANDTIEALGARPMLELLKKVGGWNVSGKFDVSSWSLQSALHVLQNTYNMGGLFTWIVSADDRNSSRNIIQIDQGGLTLPARDNYLNKTMNKKILTAYLDYMTKVGVLLNGEENSTRKQMQDVIDFETELAKLTTPLEDRRDDEKNYHNMSISALQELAPFMNWRDYFNDAMRHRSKPRKVSEKETVVVYAPEYLHNISHLIKEYNSTDKGKIILNNYLVWQMVRSMTAYMSQAFRDAYKGLRKVLMGLEGGDEPWRYCVADTSSVIGFAVGAMFVKEVFVGNSKPMAEDMINEVRDAFKRNLKNLHWMDEETRKSAEKKADAISDMIGFPNYILDPTALDETYKYLIFKSDEYFENNVRANRYNFRMSLDMLDEPVNRTRWGMSPPTVNAYYAASKNQIVFPAGLLQSPFYDIRHPHSLNYGSMGVVMGHELTHAFDDQGREYDENGNLHKWWNNRTIEKFKERTDCMVNQYSKYDLNNKYINGKQTLGENIADNGGLKAAYHAYLKWQAEHEEEMRLPGLNFTHRQLFFLSFAQVWCSASTDETTDLQIEKDTHSPPRFRVVGPLSNFDEFSKEFKCPMGSYMNPKSKCEVW